MTKQSKAKATLDKAIVIAKNVASELGYIIDELEVVADSQNFLWKKYKIDILAGNMDLKNKLGNKEYWVIYLRPKDTNVIGGNIFVFVDKNNGKVIGYLRGQ